MFEMSAAHSRVRIEMTYALTDAPPGRAPYGSVDFIGAYATVVMEAQTGHPAVVSAVIVNGYRARKDGTAGQQAITADYSVWETRADGTRRWNVAPPLAYQELADRAVAQMNAMVRV